MSSIITLLETNQLKLSVPNKDKHTHFLISLQALPENRITFAWIKDYHNALDLIENTLNDLPSSDADIGASLITTSSGKFFCNGFNINELFNYTSDFLNKIMHLYARLLAFPLPTVAAINGHGFGGGCMLALCHDFCIMNQAKGFLSMNEITIGLPVQHAYIRLVKTKISDSRSLKKCLLNGYRFPATEAASIGLIDAAVPENKILDAATELAHSQAKFAVKKGVPLGQIKSELYREAITSLRSGDIVAGAYLSKL
ncbi:hypothetical protein BB561_005395 [Smittium simulii]|uniref:Enoyl-CoA hydratase n=1 Tax=Smittium simulii TaxID=133385 RepID=A0A2T9YAL7_9FUNG|nr:hypothetical protein BB561_005395 [Smittium simulii]